MQIIQISQTVNQTRNKAMQCRLINLFMPSLC